MKLTVLLSLWGLLCTAPVIIQSQPINWKIQQVSIEDGLSNRFVNAILQDERGFMWIGTNFGLNRYDGHRMDILTQQTNNLQSNTILGLHGDFRDKIWIIYRQQRNFPVTGIDVIDPVTFEITPVQNYVQSALPFGIEDVIQVTSDEKNMIYLLLNDKSIYQFDATGLHLINPSPHARNDIYSNISTDGIIYQPTSVNDYGMAGKQKSITTEYLVNQYSIDHIKHKAISYLGQTSSGTPVLQSEHFPTEIIELFTLDENFQVDPKTLVRIDIRKYTKDFITFWDPYGKKVWVMAHPDCMIYDPSTGTLTKVDYLPNDQIKKVAFHPGGKIWLGTEDGMFTVTPQDKYFETFLTSIDTQYSCRGFTEDHKGIVYLMSHGGNFKFHPTTGRIEKWKEVFAGIAILTDRQGNIWFAEEAESLTRYNPRTEELKRWDGKGSNFYNQWSLLEAGSGEILIGATNGLWIKDPNNDDLQKHFTHYNGFDNLAEGTVYHMVETSEGFWLSTSNGLYLVDLQKGVLAHYDKSTGLPYDNLLYLHIDTDSIFWLGTRGQGLIRWDKKANTFKTYAVKEGLSHNVIYAVFEDMNGFLWMTSDYGLMRFEKNTGICRTFLPADGIPHEEFNRASYFKDKQGNFYFGGLRGFVKFNPANILNSNDFYSLLLTRFEVLNRNSGGFEDWTSRIEPGKALMINPSIKSFLIQYSLLDFEDPKLKRYAYKIEGLDDNWTYVTENFIRINGLSGGNYRVHIKGQSANGLWTDQELVIPIRVMIPFLLRPLTITIIVLFISAFTYLYIRKRIALHKAKLVREQKITQQLRHVDKLKDQFLANTSHELRTPLNGIVGLSESLLEKMNSNAEREDLEMIISSGRRLSNLVNDILDFSRLKEHDLVLQCKPVDIRAMTDHCLRLNKHSIGDKPLTLHNKINKTLPCCYADENRLQQILQNLVANAIKFTRAGSITVSAETELEMINIHVADTGIGIEESKQSIIFNEFEQADGSIAREFGGTGLGLSISKYLVELHGGKMKLVSAPGKGSTFSFSIPVYKGEQSPSSVSSKPWQLIDIKNDIIGNGHSAAVAVNGDGKKHHEILIVDDEPVNLKVLKNHLEQAGYNVTMARDGYEALEHLQSDKKFNLVLLDVMMPRIPGYEVCQKIRDQYLLSQLPVIMVTAKNQISDLVEGLSVGANDYINKPFSKEELLARVKTQLEAFDIYEATGRFVPHQFIQSLGRHGITDLMRGDMVEREVHVMFSDIRDYTTLAEDMSPKDNFNFVNSIAGKVGPIVKQHHGMINQYLGDTIMMLFLHKADDGVLAAIDIFRMIDQYNVDRKQKNRKPVQFGMGIHSGPLIMGIIGDSDRTDAAVISDTVNTASRMEGLTKHFGVHFILSDATVEKLEDKDRFNLRYLGRVQVKGRYHPIGIYECFDTDGPEQIRLKTDSLSVFNQGIEAYYKKDMQRALQCFESVYRANLADHTVFGFLRKVHDNILHGISEDWTGVEMMQFK